MFRRKKGNTLQQLGRLPDRKGYFDQGGYIVSAMGATSLGKNGGYLYKGLVERKSGTAAANAKGRTDIIVLLSLVCSLVDRLLCVGRTCLRISTGHTTQDQNKQA